MGATTNLGLGADASLTAFGETKTVAAWAADDRARAWTALILERLGEGMSPEQAIALPLPRVGSGVRLYAAFEEQKGLRDWADDPRCGVAYDTLKYRVKAGWSLESALTLPVQEKGRSAEPSLVEAWGEAKTIFDWSLDPRAGTSEVNISMRLKAGYASEEAIGRPTAAHSTEKVEAFGERKSLHAWARDPRAGATREAIRKRILGGMPVEEAIAKPAPEIWEGGLTVFGETKTLREWAEDPRCVVTASALGHRLKRGMGAEEALTKPHKFVRRLDRTLPEAYGLPAHTRLVSAFGETKSVTAWSKDARCAVEGTVLRRRIAEGMEAELAITTPPEVLPRFETAFGETKRIAEWAEDPRCAVTASCLYGRVAKGMTMEAALTTRPERDWATEPFEAFGETKTLREWAADPRCKVGYTMLQDRLSDHGMAIEVAIAAPCGTYTKRHFGEVVEAFGERKLLGEWTGDSRCVVSRKTLQHRLRRGWELERALTEGERAVPPTNVQGRFVEAFGERKNVRQWGLDARCAVDHQALLQRLDRGWEAERAITTPPMPHDHLKGKHVPRRNQRVVTAFGETKALALWSRDPRCRVNHPALAYRLDRGWDPERAIDTPAGANETTTKAAAPRGGLAAFGETKPLAAWAKDRRCVVPAVVVSARLGLGWRVEDALTVAMGVAVARAA